MAKRKQNRRPRRGAKRAAARKPTKNFKKKVLSVIRQQVETKQGFIGQSDSFNSGINAVGDAKKLVPSIGQGTGDYQRIGDSVTAISMTLRGAIVYNPSAGQYGTYANSRLGVRMMVVQPRQFANLGDVQASAATWMAFLLKKGGTTVAFTGILSDLWAPINTDGIIKYYDKVFYLDNPYQVTAIGSQDMKGSTRMFRRTFKLRNKKLLFDASIDGGLNATNYAPVLLIGYAHMDGSAADVATTAIQLHYDVVFNYEDA